MRSKVDKTKLMIYEKADDIIEKMLKSLHS